MNRFYGKFTMIALIILLHITCFGMDQQSLCDVLPLETNKTMFGFLDLYRQDQLRATCSYWKKIGDDRTSRVYLLNLLHSPTNTTTQTRTRILFDAVYHGDYDLAAHMLKGAPKYHLIHPFGSNSSFTLYSIAEKSNDQMMLDLVSKYDASKCDVIDTFFEHPILIDLLVSCVSGNSDAVKRIIDVEFKADEVCSKIRKKKTNKYTQEACIAIRDAFDFVVAYDDEKTILVWAEFFKDNRELDYFFDFSLENACSSKNKKALRALLQLLQQNNEINKVSDGTFDGTPTMITKKNEILGGTVWHALEVFNRDQEYRNEIEVIFNEYGAKTYEELEKEGAI